MMMMPVGIAKELTSTYSSDGPTHGGIIDRAASWRRRRVDAGVAQRATPCPATAANHAAPGQRGSLEGGEVAGEIRDKLTGVY
jgi:hypothetical protein